MVNPPKVIFLMLGRYSHLTGALTLMPKFALLPQSLWWFPTLPVQFCFTACLCQVHWITLFCIERRRLNARTHQKQLFYMFPCLQTYVCSCVHFVKKKKSNMFVSLSSAFHLTAPLFMLQHIAKFCSAEGWMKGQPVWCVVTMHHTTLNDARHCACAIWSITHAGWAPYIVENTTSGVGTCKGVQNT